MNILLSIKMLVAALKAVALWPHIEIQVFNNVKNVFLVNNVKCSFCDMTCPTPSDLKHHIDFRHSDEKPFSCEMCDAR